MCYTEHVSVDKVQSPQLLQLLISLLHILQTEDFQGASTFSLTADQFIDFSVTARIHQNNL